MFNEDLNETRKVLTMLITREYPDNVIKQEGDSSLSYVVSNCDSENYVS